MNIEKKRIFNDICKKIQNLRDNIGRGDTQSSLPVLRSSLCLKAYIDGIIFLILYNFQAFHFHLKFHIPSGSKRLWLSTAFPFLNCALL